MGVLDFKKVYVGEQTVEAQMAAFKLGYNWFFGYDVIKPECAGFLFFKNDGYILHIDNYDIFRCDLDYEEISLSQLLALVDGDEATYEALKNIKVDTEGFIAEIREKALSLGFREIKPFHVCESNGRFWFFNETGSISKTSKIETFFDSTYVEMTPQEILNINKKVEKEVPRVSLPSPHPRLLAKKIRTHGRSKDIQQKAFELGYRWSSGFLGCKHEDAKFLYFNNCGLTMGYLETSFKKNDCEEITLREMLEGDFSSNRYDGSHMPPL